LDRRLGELRQVVLTTVVIPNLLPRDRISQRQKQSLFLDASHNIVKPNRESEDIESVALDGLNVLRRDLARGLPRVKRKAHRKPFLKRNVLDPHPPVDTRRVL
jgi:hypothetical protein